MRRLFLFLVISFLVSETVKASEEVAHKDTVDHVPSIMVSFTPGRIIVPGKWGKDWPMSHGVYSASIEYRMDSYREALTHGTTWLGTADEMKAVAHDYGHPTLSFGLRYNHNSNVELNRVRNDVTNAEGNKVDNTSTLGDVITAYGKFYRPVFRTRHFDAGYYIGTGLGYSFRKYDREENQDNGFIGTNLNVYFNVGLAATWWINNNWGIQAALDFAHHSNGSLYKPNKGNNYIGPSLGVIYEPHEPISAEHKTEHKSLARSDNDFQKGFFIELTAGVGAKTLQEEWQYTQFMIPSTDPDYRTDKFKVYPTFTFQTDLMYRYARRWASGIGLDMMYGEHGKDLNAKRGYKDKVSPWSIGIAMRHEAYIGRLTMRCGIGYYLYHHFGPMGNDWNKNYYERIGLSYSFPKLGGLSLGFNINAHLMAADFTELQISYPIHL